MAHSASTAQCLQDVRLHAPASPPAQTAASLLLSLSTPSPPTPPPYPASRRWSHLHHPHLQRPPLVCTPGCHPLCAHYHHQTPVDEACQVLDVWSRPGGSLCDVVDHFLGTDCALLSLHTIHEGSSHSPRCHHRAYPAQHSTSDRGNDAHAPASAGNLVTATTSSATISMLGFISTSPAPPMGEILMCFGTDVRGAHQVFEV
uniref:Uncharacterized protein n=1 Tax=Arundo donax TaxID=35708 RepID=A0A0A9BWK0_ARUDO